MPVGISVCFATVKLGISACAALEEGGSIEQRAMELVATKVRLSGMRGGGLVNVGVPAKEVAGGKIPIVGKNIQKSTVVKECGSVAIPNSFPICKTQQ